MSCKSDAGMGREQGFADMSTESEAFGSTLICPAQVAELIIAGLACTISGDPGGSRMLAGMLLQATQALWMVQLP
jgi:hypothetical protein